MTPQDVQPGTNPSLASDWKPVLLVLGALVAWFVLQRWVLPALGVST